MADDQGQHGDPNPKSDAPEASRPGAAGQDLEGRTQAQARVDDHSTRFEARDVRFRFVLGALVVAAMLGAAQLYLVWILFRGVERPHTRGAAADQFMPKSSTKLPAEPRLEQLDRLSGIEAPDVRVLELSKERLLATYGPTSEEGFVHVPIERAMELVIAQLPIRRAPTEAVTGKDHGLVDYGESNSGRMFREAPR